MDVESLIEYWEESGYFNVPLLKRHLEEVKPLIKHPDGHSLLRSDLEGSDPWMFVDDCLQFSLLEDITIPDDLLDETEAEVRADWDYQIVERTLDWIAKHRELKTKLANK